MGVFLFFLALCQVALGEEQLKKLDVAPKELKIKKIELKKIEPIDNSIKLNIKPLNLDSSKIESLLKAEVEKKNSGPSVISTGSDIGKFVKLQWGDYQHLTINSNGKEISFWCSKGCEVLEKIKNKEKPEVLVIWREVERFIREANEKIKMKETTHIFYNSDQKTSFYPCTKYKKLPHFEKGCEGEGCGFLKYDKAIKPVTVLEKMEQDSKMIGNLKRCQKIEGFESYTSLSELGWVEVLTPNKQLQKIGIKKGAIIQLTSSLGEGYLTACSGNDKIDAVEQGTEQYGDVANVKTLINHKSEGWVKLKLPSGKYGYASEREDFYMGYYSYEPAHFCPEDHPCGPNFLKDLKSSEKTLSRSFKKHCEIEKGCNSNDPSKECELTKKVWSDYKKVLPEGIQCAAFGSSKSSCGKSWGGSFSCSCKLKGVDENLYYSYNCSKGPEIKCGLNINN